LPGDLDVVAFLDGGIIVMVECKSSSDVDEAHFSRFLQRTQTFRPTLAILLIDTQAPFAHARLAAFNAALHAHGYGSLHVSTPTDWFMHVFGETQRNPPPLFLTGEG
ncbi:MAG TPA: hypothetical protein DHW02_02900, partial [Ktedonobacter sp.]|nr:hypothetical protein [Ktedonobacter sp.]